MPMAIGPRMSMRERMTSAMSTSQHPIFVSWTTTTAMAATWGKLGPNPLQHRTQRTNSAKTRFNTCASPIEKPHHIPRPTRPPHQPRPSLGTASESSRRRSPRDCRMRSIERLALFVRVGDERDVVMVMEDRAIAIGRSRIENDGCLKKTKMNTWKVGGAVDDPENVWNPKRLQLKTTSSHASREPGLSEAFELER
ncbi:hypothetical protein GALMADRAFT_214844 [Galerina marginata CBS 339.88]|uniref:Uncharacterized protein n=1 Tax=Galerina marginata (strain CBS 339.88) TaxID=685588 RepID=A0A067SI76_GALM3|nr:hypothetical protein GALMADRAFT_214844 [Galerina marginata CBS 339.88]